MPRIEIDQEVYNHLLRNAQEIGESASSILRRLLNLPSLSQAPRVGGGLSSAGPDRNDRNQANSPTSPGASLTIEQVFPGISLQFSRTAVDRFLTILSAIARKHSAQFDRVLTIDGSKRRYFARSETEIKSSGASTQPKQIPGTSIWVVTNNDTPRKQRIVMDVLRLLNYSMPQASFIADLVDPDVKPVGKVPPPDDDDKI